MQTKFKSWIQSPRVKYAAIASCLAYGVVIGTVMHRMVGINLLRNENDISFNMFMIWSISIAVISPVSVLFFKAILSLELRISEMIYESNMNRKYIEIKTERIVLGMELYFKAMVYAGVGLLISALWTGWRGALLGGSGLLAGMESLLVLRYVFQPDSIAGYQEKSEEESGNV